MGCLGTPQRYLMKTLTRIILSLLAVVAIAKTVPVQSALDIHNAATAGLSPGDTLLMLDGLWIDQRISFHAVGTELLPIVLMAQTPGQVVLTGFSTLAFSGEYLEINGLNFYNGYSSGDGVIEFRRYGVRANHCRLTNTKILNYNPASITTNYKWVSVYGQHNQIDHCHFEGKTHDGATFVVWLSEEQDRNNHHIIEYNYFGPRPELGFNGGETIRIGTSTWSLTDSYTLVRHNVFEECDGEIEIISNKSCENTYFNNTFRKCAGTLTLRHGERCTVEGNYFLGEGKSEAGGVRIIDSDHVIINNYFENLFDDGYRAAISFTMGVEDSPLDRYLQVDSVLVAFNTLVNCRQSFMMGVGSSDDQTLPPINCTLANNAVFTQYYPVFHTDEIGGLPQNFSFQQNMVMGSSLGIPDTSAGNLWQDPGFDFPGEGLVRPLETSPLIGQAVELAYAVNQDMDGQSRGGSKDIGADQVSSDPIIYTPRERSDVGVDWEYEIPDYSLVEAGLNTLSTAVQNTFPGDTLYLIGYDYEFSESISIDKQITIVPGPETGPAPIVLRPSNTVTDLLHLFELKNGGKLRLVGVTIDGGGSTDNTIQRIFRAEDAGTRSIYSLGAEQVIFQNIGKAGAYAALLEGSAGSLADTISFYDCQVSHVNGTVFDLDQSEVNSGVFNANNIILRNSTFWDISQSVMSVYGGDDNPFSAGPVVQVDHCTFHGCGIQGHPTINADHVDVATIQNSIFSSSSADTNLVKLYNWSQIKYTNIYNSGSMQLNGSANIGAGMLEFDPVYVDAASGDFTLSATSQLYAHPGEDGMIYGDPRWHNPDYLTSLTENLPEEFNVMSNFPNPFNGSTRLKFNLNKAADVRLKIFNLQGNEVNFWDKGHFVPGEHEITLNLNNMDSGVYICSIEGSGQRLVKKIMLVK